MAFNFKRKQSEEKELSTIRSLVFLVVTLSLGFVMGLANNASAQNAPLSAEEERVLQEQARMRTYPGGFEESDLQIQQKLFVPIVSKPQETNTEAEF